MTAPNRPPTDDELRAIYRDLSDTARNADEAAVLLAACAELADRGYKLNADESDWIPKGEIDEPAT